MRKIHILMLLVIAAAFGAGVYFYPQLPERVASHWNARGEVNGTFSKTWELLLVPLLSLGVFFLGLYLPRLDPMKENVEKNRKYVDVFFLVLILFFAYIHALTLAWGLGSRFNMTTAIVPAVGALFFYCGVMIKNAEQNWFVGIRTPWTLSSKSVWKKTHRIGGILFEISGLLSIFSIVIPNASFAIVIGAIVFSALFSVVYSYVEFRKEKHAA